MVDKNTFGNAAIKALAGALLILGLHLLIRFLLRIHFPEEYYFQSTLFLNFFGLGKKATFLTLMVLGIAVAIGWKTSQDRSDIPLLHRIIIIGVVALLFWAFGLYQFNAYFNQWHFWDRLLLFCLGVASIFYPQVLLLFLIQIHIIAHQFSNPDFFDYSYTDKQILLDMVSITWLFFCLRSVPLFKRLLPWNNAFAFWLAIIGGWYFLAGMGKLEIGWHRYNDLSQLMLATYQYGWLSFADESLVLNLYDALGSTKGLIIYATYFAEVAVPLLVVWNRRFLIFGLLMFIAFHLLVFAVSGILFWKWIALELVIIGAISLYGNKGAEIFSSSFRLTYFVVLFLTYFVFAKTKLGWLDCGVLTKYDIILVGDAEEPTVRLDASFFAPYDSNFAQNRFYFLTQRSLLSGTFGACMHPQILEYFRDRRGESALEGLRADYGLPVRYDQADGKQFIDFVRQFVNNRAESPGNRLGIGTPFHSIYQDLTFETPDLRKYDRAGVVFSEEILAPDLGTHVIYSDTIFFNLRTN